MTLAPTYGEIGSGKEPSVCYTYWVSDCGGPPALANRGVTSLIHVDVEPPGHVGGSPSGLVSSCVGRPGLVNGGISHSDETGDPLPLT